jgi:hypothetical protein
MAPAEKHKLKTLEKAACVAAEQPLAADRPIASLSSLFSPTKLDASCVRRLASPRQPALRALSPTAQAQARLYNAAAPVSVLRAVMLWV